MWRNEGDHTFFFFFFFAKRCEKKEVIITLSHSLMLSMLGKNSNGHLEIFFLLFPENRIQHFMKGDNLHEMSNPIFSEKTKKISICCWLNLQNK